MSGNSGAEQLNIKVSVPVKETKNDGAETPVENFVQKDAFNEEPNLQESEEYKNEAVEIKSEISQKTEIALNVGTVEDVVADKEEMVENVEDEGSAFIEEIVETDAENDPVSQTENISEEIEDKIDVDISEVVGGFEEARRVLKEIYAKALNETFKPSLNDATVDLLAYVGCKAESYGRSSEFVKAFGVDTNRFADRYRQNSYLPIAFKISTWADKNKGLDLTVDLLNGLLQTLFALNASKSEVKTVEIVKESILGIIEYLDSIGINSGF